MTLAGRADPHPSELQRLLSAVVGRYMADEMAMPHVASDQEQNWIFGHFVTLTLRLQAWAPSVFAVIEEMRENAREVRARHLVIATTLDDYADRLAAAACSFALTDEEIHAWLRLSAQLWAAERSGATTAIVNVGNLRAVLDAAARKREAS